MCGGGVQWLTRQTPRKLNLPSFFFCLKTFKIFCIIIV
jgi:hypothetical protein